MNEGWVLLDFRTIVIFLKQRKKSRYVFRPFYLVKANIFTYTHIIKIFLSIIEITNLVAPYVFADMLGLSNN